jgi:hypothetical protein
MIGSVKLAIVPDEIMGGEGHLNLEQADNVGISGLNSYYALKKIADFPYARAEQLPDFSRKK